MFQMKEQDQIFEDQLNKVEISNLPNNEFKDAQWTSMFRCLDARIRAS